jgi:hypothetical protein
MAKPDKSRERGRGGAPVKPGQPNHDEWLLDESVEESFPASDPVSPSRPGSTLSKRYQTTRKAPAATSTPSTQRRGRRRTG